MRSNFAPHKWRQNNANNRFKEYFKFNRASLAVRLAASKDESRHNLAGVYLTPTCAVGSNGHILAQVTHSLPERDTPHGIVEPYPSTSTVADNALIPTQALEQALKAIPKNPTAPLWQHAFICCNGKQGRWATTDTSLKQGTSKQGAEFLLIDAEYPNYPQVLPKDPAKFSIDLNVDLLATLCKIAQEFHGKGNALPRITLQLRDETGPATIKATNINGQKLLGLIMPLNKP